MAFEAERLVTLGGQLKGDTALEDDGDGNDYVDLRTTKGYNLPD